MRPLSAVRPAGLAASAPADPGAARQPVSSACVGVGGPRSAPVSGLSLTLARHTALAEGPGLAARWLWPSALQAPLPFPLVAVCSSARGGPRRPGLVLESGCFSFTSSISYLLRLFLVFRGEPLISSFGFHDTSPRPFSASRWVPLPGACHRHRSRATPPACPFGTPSSTCSRPNPRAFTPNLLHPPLPGAVSGTP